MISGRRTAASSSSGNGNSHNGGIRGSSSAAAGSSGGGVRGRSGAFGRGGGDSRGGGSSSGGPFHPRLITAQIISLQCLHYFVLAFLVQFNALLYRTNITIDRIFTDQYVRVWHRSGWPDVCAILVASLVGYDF